MYMCVVLKKLVARNKSLFLWLWANYMNYTQRYGRIHSHMHRRAYTLTLLKFLQHSFGTRSHPTALFCIFIARSHFNYSQSTNTSAHLSVARYACQQRCFRFLVYHSMLVLYSNTLNRTFRWVSQFLEYLQIFTVR